MDKVLRAAESIWSQVSKDTKVVFVKANTVVIPIADEKATWRHDAEPWKLEYEFAGWFDKLTWQGRFWRVIGKVLKSEKLCRRGQFPHYRETSLLFGQVTIELEPQDEGFIAGYSSRHDILAVKA